MREELRAVELPELCDILNLLGNSAVNAHILLRPAALADSGVFVLTWVFFPSVSLQ